MNRIYILVSLFIIVFLVSCAPEIIDNNSELKLNINDQNMVFEKDTSMDIEWTYNGNLIKEVKLELLYNNELELIIKDLISVNEKSFNWEIPSSLEERKNYTLRIVSIEDNNMNDTIGVSFVNKGYENYTLDFDNVSDTMYFSSPREGILESGKDKTIVWVTKNYAFISNLKIELYYNNTYYLTIAERVSYNNNSNVVMGGGGGGGTIGGSTAGNMVWSIPDYIDDTLDYTMVIRNYSDLSKYNVSQKFNVVKKGTKSFNILDFVQNYPYIAGDSYNIAWYYTDDIKNVKLELYKNGSLLSVIEENLTVTDFYESNPSYASYSWIIDETIDEYENYSVKISEVADSMNYDMTLDFEILDSDTKIINLNSISSEYQVGTMVFITWSYFGNLEFVKVEIFKNDTLYHTLSDNHQANLMSIYGIDEIMINNTGGLDWIIPDTVDEGNDYKIVVTDLSDNTVFDESLEFSIVDPNN